MDELVAKAPAEGLLPVAHGGVRLEAADPGNMAFIAPFRGQTAALAAALKTAHGLDWPQPGQVCEAGEIRALWMGRGQAALLGVAPDPSLSALASVTDQSDGWVVLRLSGDGARDVLARLTPIDLRPQVFGPGQTARTLSQHMTVSITCVAEDVMQIMGFRSMAQTLVHELESAMRGVAARAALA